MDAPVYQKLTELEKENPFYTKVGQEVVSISETFEARHSRLGRIRTYEFKNMPITSGATTSKLLINNVEAGQVFIPYKIMISANVKCLVEILLNPSNTYYVPANGGDSAVNWQETIALFQMDAYRPQYIDYKGEIMVFNAGAGIMTLNITPETTGVYQALVYGVLESGYDE